MSNLATVYAEVCAKIPELTVEGLIYKPRDGKFNNVGKWLRNGHRWDEADVQALIEARWTKLLLSPGYGCDLHCDFLAGGYTFARYDLENVWKEEIWQAAAARILN